MPFDTSVLDAALARRRAKNEQTRQELLTRLLDLLAELGPTYGIQQAYIFGSLISPDRFGPHSDIDVAVEQIEATRFFEAIGKFSAVLGREVDLVELDKCHFAHRIRQKGMLWKRTT
jgi:hypothetical protein